MAYSEHKDLLDAARERFIEGDYKNSEPILQQILMRNQSLPEVYQMLATIYYDQGKFNKAIKTFKRALEVDPTYTDASIGLSIILNDIGRYEEAKKVFEQAQATLKQKKSKDPFVEEKLAAKHLDLGAMYFHYNRFEEASEQYAKALQLSNKKAEITMSLVECWLKSGDPDRAIQELKTLIKSYPQFIAARNKLGVIFYNANRVAEAAEQWESVLLRSPDNLEAKTYLRLAQETGVTALA